MTPSESYVKLRLMSIRSFPLLLLTALPGLAAAQNAPAAPWVVGAGIQSPARLLDAGDGEVASAVGFMIEGARRWRLDTDLQPIVRARFSRATTEASRGVNSWDAGAITAVDLVAAAAHPLSPRISIDAGVGLTLWSAPDDGAPFASLRGVRPLAEVGTAVRISGPWSGRLSAAGTPVAADAARAQSSGYLWRLFAGVHRDF